jgi:hypothetical protein
MIGMLEILADQIATLREFGRLTGDPDVEFQIDQLTIALTDFLDEMAERKGMLTGEMPWLQELGTRPPICEGVIGILGHKGRCSEPHPDHFRIVRKAHQRIDQSRPPRSYHLMAMNARSLKASTIAAATWPISVSVLLPCTHANDHCGQ